MIYSLDDYIMHHSSYFVQVVSLDVTYVTPLLDVNNVWTLINQPLELLSHAQVSNKIATFEWCWIYRHDPEVQRTNDISLSFLDTDSTCAACHVFRNSQILACFLHSFGRWCQCLKLFGMCILNSEKVFSTHSLKKIWLLYLPCLLTIDIEISIFTF